MQTKYECEFCEDTGEVTTMEAVYAGEPHTAPIGSGTCPHCKAEDEYDDQEM